MPRQRYKRGFKQRFVDPVLIYSSPVVSAAAGYSLINAYKDFNKNLKGRYLRNINAVARRNIPRKQRIFSGMGTYVKGQAGPVVFKKERFATKKVIDEIQKRNFKNTLHKLHRSKLDGSQYKFFRQAKRDMRFITPKFHKKLPKELIALNRASLGKAALKFGGRSIIPLLGLFGSVPLAMALTSQYAKKRRFKKELRRSVRAGVITPSKGAARGIPLEALLRKYPSLRRSPEIQRIRGKYHQQYGQGVRYYTGTSGMKVR